MEDSHGHWLKDGLWLLSGYDDRVAATESLWPASLEHLLHDPLRESFPTPTLASISILRLRTVSNSFSLMPGKWQMLKV